MTRPEQGLHHALVRSETSLMPDPSRLAVAHSIDEAIHLVGTTLWPHKLALNEREPRGLARLSALELGDCALVGLKYGFHVDIDAGCIADYFMLKWTLAGEGLLSSGKRVVTTSPRFLVMTSPTERTCIRMTPACQHLTARIDRRVIEERLAQKLGRRLKHPLEFDLEIAAASEFGHAWCQLVKHICEISATAPSVLAQDQVRSQYSRTMIELLLHAAPHNYAEVLRQNEVREWPRHVSRAQNYVDAHLHEIRSVAEIASAVGVTARTLQNGFKRALNVSPAEYVRRARVQALHQALLSADASQSVTTLMASVGIVNFGRYAQYYRQQVGVAPSVTLRKTV